MIARRIQLRQERVRATADRFLRRIGGWKVSRIRVSGDESVSRRINGYSKGTVLTGAAEVGGIDYLRAGRIQLRDEGVEHAATVFRLESVPST